MIELEVEKWIDWHIRMKWLRDLHNRRIRLTDERRWHIETDHPEMSRQLGKIEETLLEPERIVQSQTDPDAQLFYRYYDSSPVSEKYLCVVVKTLVGGPVVITAYFTDTVKRGEVVWQKK